MHRSSMDPPSPSSAHEIMDPDDERHSLVSGDVSSIHSNLDTDAQMVHGSWIDSPDENHSNTTPQQRESLVFPTQARSIQTITEVQDAVVPQRPSCLRQLGKMAIFTLILGTLVILLALSFTAFLWFANISNPTWHAIVVRDWLTEATTILSEAIKQALNVQVGVCGAMLAALALERGEISLGHAASLTTMRNGLGSSKVLRLSKIQFQSRKAANGPIVIPLLVILETVILAFGQVITIVLTSDIGLYPVPGHPQSSQTPFGFTYIMPNNSIGREELTLTRGSSWSRKAPYFPTFAEYTEPPFVQDGVSDTGLTLRAFLPYSSAQTRGNMYSYEGNTTVLDARVTCQVPSLKNEGAQYTGDGVLNFNGDVRASRPTPRLANLMINDLSFGEIAEDGLAFACLAFSGDNHSGNDQWRTTLCQLGDGGDAEKEWGGGLISEFSPNLTISDPKNQLAYGTAYLILNVTRGSAAEWAAAAQAVNDNPTVNATISPSQYSSRQEWLDLIWANGDLVLSVSLCYTAFDTADIPIAMSSKANRTEPDPYYDFGTLTYNYGAVREQLGQYDSQISLEERGLLQLNKQSWIANGSELPPVEPYIRDFANFQGPTGTGNRANWSALLWESQPPNGAQTDDEQYGEDAPYHIIPDITHVWLFQQIVQSGGSAAFALQSLITVLSSITYYDQLGLFDKEAMVSQASFVTSNTPRHFRGFLAVVLMLAVHLILVVIIVLMFLRGTRYSMLGNDWQGLAQGVTPETEAYLAVASRKSDNEIEQKISGEGLKNLRVGIGEVEGTAQVGIVRYQGIRRRNPGVVDQESGAYELQKGANVEEEKDDNVSFGGNIHGYGNDDEGHDQR